MVAEAPSIGRGRAPRQEEAMVRRSVSVLSLVVGLASAAHGAGFSTSVVDPTPVEPSGVIESAFPDSGKATYYLSIDLKAGDLLTQVGFDGRGGAQKSVDLALLDANARARDNYWVQGTEPSEEKTRSFAIDASGKQLIRLEVAGPATAKFRVELGGSALPSASPKATAGSGLSRSIFNPTPVAAGGVVQGALPGKDAKATYYLAVDVQKGELLTQIAVQSRDGADKSLDFQMLEQNARSGETYWVHGSSAAEEKTRSFPIDRGGKQIIRLVVSGPESGTFRVELGGSAIAQGAAANASAKAEQPPR
jgi:hypothetical protein